jgi:hypothetical protein
MAQFNKDPQKDYAKVFNGTIPRSQQNSGGDLDSFCPEIEHASAGNDEGVEELAQQVENSPPVQWIASGYNAGDESNSEAVSNLGEAIYNAGPGPLVNTVATAVGADGRTKRAGKDSTEFTRQTTSREGSPANGPSGLPLMSEVGKELASKTAPASAYKTTTIGTSGVDRMMRGGK